MFTGIVTAVGEVVGIEEGSGFRAIEIRVDPPFLQGVREGDSIAIDGACLTPVKVEGGRFRVQAVAPTLAKTRAGRYRSGTRVNLEKALRMGDRLDGHLITGHIDSLGYLRNVVKDGEAHRLEVELPPEVARLTLPQGSIVLNGVSLTVSRVLDAGRIEVTIIPHTLAATNLGDLAPGDPVNVEGDMFGKYVEKVLAERGFAGGSGRGWSGRRGSAR